MMISITLLNTQRDIHEDDFNDVTLRNLNNTLASKIPVKVKLGDKIEYALMDDSIGAFAKVKFVYNLIGKLYEDDAWESTTSFVCDKSRIQLLTEDEY